MRVQSSHSSHHCLHHNGEHHQHHNNQYNNYNNHYDNHYNHNDYNYDTCGYYDVAITWKISELDDYFADYSLS